MTREEAVKILKEDGCGYCTWQSTNPYECENKKCEVKEAFDMAISALEQEPICPSAGVDCEDCPAYEPCEDAISRQAVLDLIEHYNSDGLGSVFYGYEHGVKFADAVNKLPSVRPQEQTGKWEKIVKEHKCYARDDTYTTTEYHCSECGSEPFVNEDGFYEFSNYCPNCGAKMVEPQESEDKE